MAQIAGAVMFVLFLVAVAAVFIGAELLRGPDGRVLMLVPALILGMIALMALGTVGVIAAILATKPLQATATAVGALESA